MTSLPWWANLTITIAAVLVALGTIRRHVWPVLRGIVQLLEDFRDTGGFAGIASTIRDLAVDLTHVRELAERADHELHPNKGLSLRDSVTRTEQGIERLGQQVAAVTDQATAISERQEILRAADESTAADLRRFLDGKVAETEAANQHLRAALNEVLSIEGDENADRV